MDMTEGAVLFEAVTPLGLRVRVTLERWRVVTTVKHPVMAGRDEELRAVLSDPEEIRQSRSDEAVLLHYRAERPGRWLCAVVKRQGGEGFLITAYLTDAIKAGVRLWSK